MKTTALVLGNGESRKGIDFRSEYPGTFVIGCNGAYKESPDALVCTDTYMQHIIYETGYCKDHFCLFTEWDPIPNYAVDAIAASFNKPIIRHNVVDSESAQVAGSEHYVYVTHTHPKDMVEPIPEKTMSSGSRAIEIACQMGFSDIILLGFDGMGATNIYQHDKGYERSTPRAEWVEERNIIKNKFPNINIIEGAVAQ